jgi:hypothetical protein
VGGGTGTGNGTEVSTTPPELEPVSDRTVTTGQPVASAASPAPWISAGLVGVAVGAGVTLLAIRLGKKGSAA